MKHRKLFRAIVIITVLPLGQISGQSKASSAIAQQNRTSDASSKRIRAATMQQLLVKKVEAGARLDDPVPESIIEDLEHVQPTEMTGAAKQVGDLKKRPTYSDALQWIANQREGDTVKIHVEAVPKQCTVEYSAMTDRSHWSDLGLTTVDRSLRPNYYVLRCDCAVPVPEQKVDCTIDCSTRFGCGGGGARR